MLLARPNPKLRLNRIMQTWGYVSQIRSVSSVDALSTTMIPTLEVDRTKERKQSFNQGWPLKVTTTTMIDEGPRKGGGGDCMSSAVPLTSARPQLLDETSVGNSGHPLNFASAALAIPQAATSGVLGAIRWMSRSSATRIGFR